MGYEKAKTDMARIPGGLFIRNCNSCRWCLYRYHGGCSDGRGVEMKGKRKRAIEAVTSAAQVDCKFYEV